MALLALAGTTPDARAEARHAAMVIDANTGQVLHSQAGDEPRFPASLTKMMTLYMAFELIDQGRLTYQSRIKMTQEGAAQPPSKLDLDPGEEIVLIDAIRALVTKSANDVAVALAQHIGGSEANFARLMTVKARQLGMKSTTFRNASGLPDSEQVTTARDMLTLALRLQDDFPRHYGLFNTRSFTFNGARHANHNTLLSSYQGTDGIKTGYTRASGFNLVSSVRRGDRHIVAAVFGGTTAAARNAHMRSLLDRAFPRASIEKTRKPILVSRPLPAARPNPPAAIAAAPVMTPPQPAPREPIAREPVARPRIAVAAPPAAAARVGVTSPKPAEPARPAAAERAAEFAGETASKPQIEISRVRRVMVAPRIRPETAPRETNDETLASTPTAPPPATVAAATPTPPAAIAPLERIEPERLPPAAVSAPAPPLSAQPLAVPLDPPTAKMAAARPTSVAMAPPSALGARPSTLAAQADNLARGAPPVTPIAATSVAPPALRPTAAAGTGRGVFHVQVGAYNSPAEASRQLAAISARAGAVLSSATTLTLPIQKGERQLFRARYAGFDAQGAANACLELRRLAVDCFVMKAE